MPQLPLLRADVSLQPLNTFGLAARAATFAVIESEEELLALRHSSHWGAGPALVLGGGSNLVLTRDVAGLVVFMANKGMTVRKTPDAVLVECKAGENWNAVVDATLKAGIGGLENLISIPGSVGAAPVQNIGAYGVELAQRLESVTALDCAAGSLVKLSRDACQFGYRDSLFRRSPGRFLITAVTLRLPVPWQPNLTYGELRSLDAGSLSPAQVAQKVAAMRKAKLPDPGEIPNAGSFFKNPVVPCERLDEIRVAYPDIVSYPAGAGTVKLAAAWMIEACGWKGRALGQVAMHERQALVMVNRGRATAAEVLGLASVVEKSVFEKFGVTLEREPIVI